MKEKIVRWLPTAGMILSALAVLVFVVSLQVQGKQSNTPLADVAADVEGVLDMSTMQQADNQMVKRLYGIDPADYEGVLLFYPTTNMGAEELLIVRLGDVEQQETVQLAIERRLESQKASFDGYGVEQTHLLENAVIEIQGNCVLFVVHTDAASAQQAFLNAL